MPILKPKISTRLLLWFLVIALLPMAVVGYVGYFNSEKALREEIFNSLLATAQRESREIESYLRERERSVTALSRGAAIAESIEAFQAAMRTGGAGSSPYNAAERAFRPFLAHWQESSGYVDLLLISLDGTVVFSAAREKDFGTNLKTGPYQTSGLGEAFETAVMIMGTVITDYRTYPATNETAAFIATPVFQGPYLIGVVAVRMDLQKVNEIASDFVGLGRTGETLVVAHQSENTARFITRRRHASDSGKQILTVDSVDSPILAALRGKKGSGVTLDDRNQEVLASWSYLPYMGWGIVVKIDTAEAFEPIVRLRRVSLLIASSTLVLVVLAAFFVSRSISRPIKGLTRTADSIAAGDLTVRVEEGTNEDEIGHLLSAMRTMTQKLNTLVGQVHRSSVQVTGGATQIAAASKQQEATAQEFGSATHEIVSTAQAISATSQELAHTMVDVNRMAENTTHLAHSGRTGLTNLQASMDQLLKVTHSFASKLSVLREKADNITGIVSTITRVADQTNLLSLNAAIEAEKAGKYGSGFAVVAKEIRRLADQTAVATLDIERSVTQIQAAVSEGVSGTETFSREVGNTAETVATVSSQLESILQQIQNLTVRFETVTQGTQSQSAAAGQIAESMTQLSDSAQVAVESLVEFSTVAEELSRAAAGLRSEVAQFKLN